MNKMIKTGLMVSMMAIAGGLPFVTAQEPFRDNNAMENETTETYQMPMQDGSFFQRPGHCIDQMEDGQEHPMFNHRFESNRQQHRPMHRGMRQR